VAINFPDSPINGQQFGTSPSWLYDGEKWRATTTSGGTTIDYLPLTGGTLSGPLYVDGLGIYINHPGQLFFPGGGTAFRSMGNSIEAVRADWSDWTYLVTKTPAPGANDQTVATTAFVQNAVSGGVGGYLPLTGGTLSGALTINAALTVNGALNTYGNIYAYQVLAGGYQTRAGLPGPATANAFNIQWDGNATLWIDNTRIGTLAIGSLGNYLPLGGGTLSGNLVIGAFGYPSLTLNATTGGMQILGNRNGVARWLLRVGSDDGLDDFTLHRYTDAGALNGEGLRISRSSGIVSVGSNLRMGGSILNFLGNTGDPWSGGGPLIYADANNFVFKNNGWLFWDQNARQVAVLNSSGWFETFGNTSNTQVTCGGAANGDARFKLWSANNIYDWQIIGQGSYRPGELWFYNGKTGGLPMWIAQNNDIHLSGTTYVEGGFLKVGPAAGNVGFAWINPGTTGNTGYFAWHLPNGTRQAYLGWDTVSLGLHLEQGGDLRVYGSGIAMYGSGGSIGRFFDDGNTHIECNVALWLNYYTGQTVTCGGLFVAPTIRVSGYYLYLANGSGNVNAYGGPFIYADSYSVAFHLGTGNGQWLFQNVNGVNVAMIDSLGNYFSNGTKILQSDAVNTGYTKIYCNNGYNVGFYSGGPADYSNYYRMSRHNFDNLGGDANWVSINATELYVAVGLRVNTSQLYRSDQINYVTNRHQFWNNTFSTTFAYFDQSGCWNSTGTWGNFSDRQVKRDIEPYEAGLDAIAALRPVSYKYRDDVPFADDRTHYGLIAQELEEVLPELVEDFKLAGYGTIKATQPGQLLFVCINAIRELKERLEALEGRA
jgi:hypothetical protein